MGRYSGNLIRTYASADEPAGSFRPDPAHGVVDTPEYYRGSHTVAPDQGVEFAGSEFPMDLAIGNGVEIDRQFQSHEGFAGRRMVYTDDQYRETITRRHSDDGQHGYVRSGFAIPPVQESTTVYSDESREDNTWGENANNTGAVSILRGNKTAIPQNNPEGVRAGLVRTLTIRMDRRLGRRRYRYQPQQLLNRATYQDANVPAQTGNPTIGVGVLDSWQPATAFSRLKKPALFTTPPTVDESELAFNTGTSDNVIGTGF